MLSIHSCMYACSVWATIMVYSGGSVPSLVLHLRNMSGQFHDPPSQPHPGLARSEQWLASVDICRRPTCRESTLEKLTLSSYISQACSTHRGIREPLHTFISIS